MLVVNLLSINALNLSINSFELSQRREESFCVVLLLGRSLLDLKGNGCFRVILTQGFPDFGDIILWASKAKLLRK